MTTAASKERPPEPVENPGPCPIDLPVRVASLDSLRHFEGLIGHCPETAIIESRAWRANQPRAVRDAGEDSDGFPAWRIRPNDGLIEAGGDDADEPELARTVRASQVRGKRAPRPAPGETRVIASRDGTQVAIVPAPEHFWDAPAVDAPISADPGDAAPLSAEVEAVLALRPQSYRTPFDQRIAEAARTHSVDPLLLHSVIKQESSYRPAATSRVGARGLMQVMPATGRQLGVKSAALLYDPQTNIDAGARLLSQLWHTFGGDIDLVLAAYNAGEGAVRKYGNSVPPYRETRDYVARVKTNYRQLAAESGLVVNF